MKTKRFALIFLCLALVSPAVFAAEGDSYGKNFVRTWKRGFTNVLTSPLEIPVTMQEYHEKAGRPFVRQSAGFVDGTCQMVERAASGLVDLFAAFLPGMQDGIPVKPETLF